MSLQPSDKGRIYEYMLSNGYSRLTAKILLGYSLDGMDRLAIILGKATEYDYKLLEDEAYRASELYRIHEEANQAIG